MKNDIQINAICQNNDDDDGDGFKNRMTFHLSPLIYFKNKKKHKQISQESECNYNRLSH